MRVDALRYSRVEYIAMLGTTKMTNEGLVASRSVAGSLEVSAGVVALVISIIGVLLLITGGGPPI